MTYELTIDDRKEKQVIAFLKQLDFVKLKKIPQTKSRKKKVIDVNAELPYFGTCVNWDAEAADLRKGSNKRLLEW